MRNIHRSRNFYTPRNTVFVLYFTINALGTPFAAKCQRRPVSHCTQTTHLLHHEGPAEAPHIFCRWIPVCSYTGWRPNQCACNSKWGFQKFVLVHPSIKIWDSPLAFRRSPIATLWHLCARAVCLQLDTREDCSLAGIQHVAYTNEAISTNNALKYIPYLVLEKSGTSPSEKSRTLGGGGGWTMDLVHTRMKGTRTRDDLDHRYWQWK